MKEGIGDYMEERMKAREDDTFVEVRAHFAGIGWLIMVGLLALLGARWWL